jgi:large subunit ribosomal protein L29
MRVLRLPTARVAAPVRASSTVCRVQKLNMSEVRGMSNEELDSKVAELKTDLLYIRMAQAAREKFKGADMPAKRRDIARCLTVKREREIAEGISKRESRKLEKQRLMDAGLWK